MPRQIKYKWTDEELIAAVKEATSIRQLLLKLNLVGNGGNYIAIPKRIKELGLDISHFLGRGHLKGKTHNWAPNRELDDVLVENSTYVCTYSLKNRLINEQLLQEICSICGLTEWCNTKLSLQLDHINGKRTDNRIENLRLLCPNCHSQTDTFAGRNSKNRQVKSKVAITKQVKTVCPKAVKPTKAVEEKQVYVRKTKIDWPDKNTLQQKLWEKPTVKIAEELGVSDKAVEKHAKHLGLTKPNRGYWAKLQANKI